jgi:ribosomal protein S18 acetylase RimI-like enzyme
LTITVVPAVSGAPLDEARALMRDFVAWQRIVFADHLEVIDGYFDAVAFDAELAGLPGKYAPPAGTLLLARVEGRSAGVVGLRALDDATCEMKRMFVRPEFHGRGVGRALARQLLADAKAAGYTRMRLDTSTRQIEAQRLYESLGFRKIAAYYTPPPGLKDWLVYFEREL